MIHRNRKRADKNYIGLDEYEQTRTMTSQPTHTYAPVAVPPYPLNSKHPQPHVSAPSSGLASENHPHYQEYLQNVSSDSSAPAEDFDTNPPPYHVAIAQDSCQLPLPERENSEQISGQNIQDHTDVGNKHSSEERSKLVPDENNKQVPDISKKPNSDDKI